MRLRPCRRAGRAGRAQPRAGRAGGLPAAAASLLLALPVGAQSPAADAEGLEIARVVHQLERSDPASALQRSDELLERARARHDEGLMAAALLHRSHALRLLGQHGEALAAGEDARRHAEAAEVERTQAAALANLAVLYEVGGLEAEALSLHRRAMMLFERQGRHDAVASTLLNLGNLFETRDELAEAAAAYRRALQIKREHGLPGTGAALGNLALVAIRRGRHAEALELLDQAVDDQRRDENPLGVVIALRNRATALIGLGRDAEAEASLDSAWQLASSGGHRLGQAAVAEGRAELLAHRAGEPPDRHLLRAALAANAEALQHASGAEPARRARLLRLRAELAERSGEPALALAALREAEALSERDRQRTTDLRYAVLSAYYDSERQRARIAALQDRAAADAAELSRQRILRNSLIVCALLLGAIALLLLARARQRRQAGQTLASHNRNLVTALAAAERERTHAQEAERLNRDLLHVAAEDLRVPLTATLGSAERLLMLAGDTALRREAAGIADTLQHLVQVVNNLIESAELERRDAVLPRQPLDLAALLRGVCEHYTLRASEKRQSLHCELPDSLPMSGDAERLREAFEHLVGNALKFTPPGRTIDVALVHEGKEGDAAAAMAVVRVRDRGPGLREQDRERLFGKLQRLSARPTGSEHSAGLGLWLVKRIAELHGGSVDAQPAPDGEGSVFTLRLPLREVG